MNVHAIDGTYELFRAWFGAPPSTSPSGMEVGAMRAMARSMLRLIRNEGATHVGIAFDHTVESFRNEMFDGYKTGEGLEPQLEAQFHPAEDLCRALGFVVWPMVEFEADDALATAAKIYGACEGVDQVRLCTPDKDLTQSVRSNRIVCVDRRREIVLDEDAVEEKFGVPPRSMPDYLALVGDTADGIPGIPRWGAKSTAQLLQAYPSLDLIPDDVASWTIKVRGGATLASNLASMRKEAQLYRELAILRTDAPIKETLDELRWRGPNLPELERLAAEIGDRGLVGLATSVPVPE